MAVDCDHGFVGVVVLAKGCGCCDGAIVVIGGPMVDVLGGERFEGDCVEVCGWWVSGVAKGVGG